MKYIIIIFCLCRSQHGQFSCFRNEMKDGLKVQITSAFMANIPTRGTLEFDFCIGSFIDLANFIPEEEKKSPVTAEVHSTKSSPKKASKSRVEKESPKLHKASPEDNIIPLHDRRFLRIMHNCLLLKESDYPSALAKLQKMKRSSDDCIIMRPLSTCGKSRLHERYAESSVKIFKKMEKFYDSLKDRNAEIAKGVKLEEVKTDYMQPPSVVPTPRTPLTASPEKTKPQKVSALVKDKEKEKEESEIVKLTVDTVISPKATDVTAPISAIAKGKALKNKAQANREAKENKEAVEAAAKKAAEKQAKSAAAALAFRIAAIMYVFEDGDPDLVYEVVDIPPPLTRKNSSLGLAPELSRAVSSLGADGTDTPPTGLNAFQMKKLREAEEEENKRKIAMAKKLTLQKKNAVATRNTQIQKLTHIVATSTDPETIQQSEATLEKLKRERVDQRRINFKKFM